MTPRLQELLNIGKEILAPALERERMADLLSDSRVGATALAELLSIKNGFYAFDSALLVRPFSSRNAPLGIVEWNAPSLWKYEYAGSLDDVRCFAEDVFGGQFALGREAVVAIDPETGEQEEVAKTLEGWAEVLLLDSSFRTGQPLAHDWQLQHGHLPAGHRLVPKVPFVTGGKFVLENLYSAADVEAMRFRGSIARQLRDLPDGAHVTFEVKPPRES